MRSANLLSCIALGACFALGCTGNVLPGGGEGAPPAGGPAMGLGSQPDGGLSGTPTANGTANGTGVLPLRQLTRNEYELTVRELLGDDQGVAASFTKESRGPSGYATPGLVGSSEVNRFMSAAEQLARAAVARGGFVPACSGDERSCAQDFIRDLGRRAFRRRLTDTERGDFLALYDEVRKAPIEYAHVDGLRVVLIAMLQSPQFLYHWELGDAPVARNGELVTLAVDQVASRLSYLLWNSMPDAELFAAVDNGALVTAEQVAAQARRMLKDEKALGATLDFFGQWLDLDRTADLTKDPKIFPAWNDDLRASILSETQAFLRNAVLERGTMEALLTSRAAFGDSAIARIYGAPSAGELGPERSGLFTRAGFLAIQSKPDQSSPVKRGLVVLDRLLCLTVPPPPPDIDNTPPPVDTSKQTREQYAMHSSSAACRSCHQLIDPFGFAFEQFDGIGQYRTLEAGRPVDASGEVILDGQSRAFTNATELMNEILTSEDAARCMARQWTGYAVGRALGDADKGTLDAVHQAFAKSGLDFRELLVALVSQPSFSHRMLAAGESLP